MEENKETETYKYKSNLNKFITSSVIDNLANVIISSSFIVAYALYLGMEDWMVGLLVNLSQISAIAQFFTTILIQKIGENKKSVITMYSLYRIFGYAPIVIPFLVRDTSIRAIIFIIFMGLSHVFGALAYAPLVNWQMTLTKPEDRRKVEGHKNSIINILGMITLFIVGIVLEKFTSIDMEYSGFLVMFSMVIVLSIIDISIRIFTYKPGVNRLSENIKFKDMIIIPIKDKSFQKILLYMCIAKMGISLGIQYLSLYQIKYLEINYIYVSILSAILSISTAVASVFIGKKLQNVKWKKILMTSYFFLILNYIITIIITKEYSFLLIVSTAFYGLGVAGIELFKGVGVYNSAPDDKKVMYLSIYSAISGTMTLIVSMLGKYLIDNIIFMNPIIFVFILTIIIMSIAIIYINRYIKI